MSGQDVRLPRTKGKHAVRRPCVTCNRRTRRYADEVSAKLAAGPPTNSHRYVIVACGAAWHVIGEQR